VRRWLLLLVVAVEVGASACTHPPDKEMQQAQGAIDAARAAGADQYGRDEFAAAEEALRNAHEAVAQRDYRLALNDALDSRERAQNAAKEAAHNKAAARADADRALFDATAAIAAAQTKLKTAEASHLPAPTLREARSVLADSERHVQEARTAFEKGDYLAVVDAVSGTLARLAAAGRDLDATLRLPARRRR